MVSPDALLASLSSARKNKKAKKGNKSRKLGRNFRWEYTSHSITRYRAAGRRERNKARRAERRIRGLARAAARRAARLRLNMR